VKQVGVDIVLPRHLGDAHLSRQAFPDDPGLLSLGPSPAPFGTGKYRRRHHVPVDLRVNGHTSSRANQLRKAALPGRVRCRSSSDFSLGIKRLP
jgi:hypothetical protein